MSDASMREVEQRTNVRKGIIILRKSGSTVHVIIWSLNLARCLARCPCTAGLLAAANAVDKLIYIKNLLKKLSFHQPTESVMNSRVTIHLCLLLSKPAEVRNKIVLITILEEHR